MQACLYSHPLTTPVVITLLEESCQINCPSHDVTQLYAHQMDTEHLQCKFQSTSLKESKKHIIGGTKHVICYGCELVPQFHNGYLSHNMYCRELYFILRLIYML